MRKKVLIIAEAGVNHNGDIELAKKMIDAAADAGADYVKFQTFKTEKLVSKTARKAAYQEENLQDADHSQFTMLKNLELDIPSHQILIDHCRKKDIGFLSTAFDLESIDELENLGIDFFKIPSGEITNLPYLRKIGAKRKQVILSTGMATMGEIESALTILTSAGTERDQIIVLHCNTEYPTPMEDVNLLAMLAIKDGLKVDIGYSDHTLGIEIAIAATALGATVIEKHFTLDKNMIGPDHKASLEPHELCAMIEAIRNIERALGNGIKQPSKSERGNLINIRKSIVASLPIKKGEILNERNITIKRPGTGINPMEWDKIIGHISSKDFMADEIITL